MTLSLQIPGLAGAAAIVVASGLWLARTGRPYSSALLTVHKLVALLAVIIIAVLVYRTNLGAALAARKLTVVGLSALLVIVSFATGGMLSAMAAPPAWITWAHRILPYLTVLSLSVTVFLVAGRR
ncbi:MAG TPA: hypothetical protein VNT75_00585 [Symbiobacteriaceae bacterium]|nr:hypothetical protein [Symbiobacteriaceae bacterium]